MNTGIWDILNELRGIELKTPQDTIRWLGDRRILLSASERAAVASFVLSRGQGKGGAYYVPEQIVSLFAAVLDGVSATTVCDPWADLGAIIATTQGVTKAKNAFAFSQNETIASFGKVCADAADWQVGDPLSMLAALKGEIDVVASVLPFGATSRHPLTLKTPQGTALELRDDLGHLILAAAAHRLSANGVGVFVVPPVFFLSERSVLKSFEQLGLGIEAALALPAGTFAPYTNIQSYLVVVRRRVIPRMFVAQLANDQDTNAQVIKNLKDGKEGGSLELGRYVDVSSFRGLDAIRMEERFKETERRFGAPAIPLEKLATAINLGRFGSGFAFPEHDNTIFIPLIGISDVRASINDLTLKAQNYAQVVIDPSKSNAGFVANFLNSELGKEIRSRYQTGVIPKLNKRTLGGLPLFIPALDAQKAILEIESRIITEQNVLLGLQNELLDFRRELWSSWRATKSVDKRLGQLSTRLTSGLKQHANERLDRWFETLPFPLASILRAWQATQSEDFKTKYEHLLHFFEATAEFVSVIYLSAFSSREQFFLPHKTKIRETLQDQHLSFQQATFGTWKLVVEYFAKQTRILLAGEQESRSMCAEMFADQTLALPEMLSHKELVTILSTTNKMRNDWTGHGGVLSQEEARGRNEQLVGEVQKVRATMGDAWAAVQLIHAIHSRLRRGMYENEVSVLMGSNGEFLKENRMMSVCLDVERLYLTRTDERRALQLLPLVHLGSSPASAKNACYFFNRVEKDGVRFVSYHFAECPELKAAFVDTSDAIKFLGEI